MKFDEAVNLSLKTWYPKDHELHMNPHHPLGKLLGEWGELLDDYMKSIYKPGYEFKPEDELGDIWYYIRILAYQKGYVPGNNSLYIDDDIDYIIACAMTDLGALFKNYKGFHPSYLDIPYSALKEIASRYNLTLDDLTASNWEKLKPGSERGGQWMGEQWREARVNTNYVGGKIAHE